MQVFMTNGSGYIGQATIAALGSDAMSFAKIYSGSALSPLGFFRGLARQGSRPMAS